MAYENYDLNTSKATLRPRGMTKILGLAILRCMQLTIGFVVLCLTGFAASEFSRDKDHTFALTIVNFTFTVLVIIYVFLVPRKFPKLYYHRAYICLELTALIFWISGFSLLVWECQSGDQVLGVLATDSDNPTVIAWMENPNVRAAIVGLKIGIGLSAINAILFATTLILSRTKSSH